MKINGWCDFCGHPFDAEGGLFADAGANKDKVKSRPFGWAAWFPWNRAKLPEGVTFDPESLKRAKVTTRVCCPDCVRHSINVFVSPEHDQEQVAKLFETTKAVTPPGTCHYAGPCVQGVRGYRFHFDTDARRRETARRVLRNLPGAEVTVRPNDRPMPAKRGE